MIDQLENDPSSGLPISPFPSSFATLRIRGRNLAVAFAERTEGIVRTRQRIAELK